jgi:bacteriorhodopsin
MTDADDSRMRRAKAMRELVFAGLCEVACIVAGVIAFLLTGKWIWIAIGVVASLGFSIPAVISFLRVMKERDRASR